MATDLVARGAEEPDDRKPPEPRSEKSEGQGFFTIYKKGQGYWTRICSAIGAAFLVILTARFIYQEIPPYIPSIIDPTTGSKRWLLLIIGVFVIAAALLIWKLMNKPANADFLIATDSEMKKVNWTSGKELWGSTKVVIGFMFLIATLLFVFDLYFTRVFFLFGVLATDAPLWIMVGRAYGQMGKAALDVVVTLVVFGGVAWGIWGALRSK